VNARAPGATRRGSAGVPDLAVIGAGVMGSWTALRAQESGRATMLVDAYGAGHPRATSGDENRIIRASHGDDAFYTRWSRDAREAWMAAGEAWGERLFVEAGCLWFANRGDGFEATSERTLRALDIPVERLTAAEIRKRWPQVGLEDHEFGLFEPEAGLLLARKGVQAVVAAFNRSGGSFELLAVQPGTSRGDRLLDVVGGDGRRLAAHEFVFACGPWLPRLFPEAAGTLIRVTKQDVIYVGPPGGDGRWAADRLPCWVDYDASFYGIPAVEGRGFKIGPDRYGPVFDPSSGDRIVDPDSVRLARSYIERRFPDLARQPIVETRVCQYETTPDTHFVIDRHPAWSNVWLVGGGSGHGFKHGPRIGEYVVSRLDGADATEDEARFSLDRPRLIDQGLRTGGDSIVAAWQGY
jgi:sarcosine oxidase